MISHVTIHTSKLNESVEFYQWLLNLPIAVRMQSPSGEIVFLGAEETKLELIGDENAALIDAESLSIGFAVDDLEAKIAMLDSKNIPHSPIISPAPAIRFIFFNDLNGCKIQLFAEGQPA